MKTIRIFLVSLLVSALAASCGAYSPVCVDVPLIREKGEVQLEGAPVLLGGEDFVGLRGSFAWGFAENLSAAASIDPFRTYGQAMVGTFRPMSESFVWELYAGYGYGKGRYSNPEEGYGARSRYMVEFLQFDAGWVHRNVDVAFGLKAGAINAHSEFSLDTSYFYFSRNVVGAHGTRLLLEPTAELRFGWQDFKFNLKVGLTWIFNNRYPEAPCLIPYYGIGYGAGISYRFRPCQKQK